MASALARAEQDTDHHGSFRRAVLPVVRHAGLLDDGVAGPERDFGTAHHEHYLAAQDRDVIQGGGRMRVLEAVRFAITLAVALGGAACLISRAGRDLDDPEAGPAGRRLQLPGPG